jgi:hypothetical protein
MKYKIVKLSKFSGNAANIYTIYLPDKDKTLFDLFISENQNSFKSELNDIVKRLNAIGLKVGACESFFKLNEGLPGDGVCALYDRPDKNLRLYCIRYSSLIVILGGGGTKPKNINAFQKNQKLTNENYFLRKVVKDIKSKMELGEMEISSDGAEFIGNLEINDYDEEYEKS